MPSILASFVALCCAVVLLLPKSSTTTVAPIQPVQNYANSTVNETTEDLILVRNDTGGTTHKYPDIPGIPAEVAGNGSASAPRTCIIAMVLLFFQYVIITEIDYLFSLWPL
ncbi:unnamed protein product [Lymnaea stagnalis]|uniref:Uncharacterized protein n=1 Tax=Lymnaea stagnalis TaxID=6523 RepID=A0AAV2IFC0_LYMST